MDDPEIPMDAVVAGGAPAARRRAAVLLADAGFAVGTAGFAGARAQRRPSLVILLDAELGTPLVRRMRSILQHAPDALVVPVLPAGTPHALMRRALVAGAAGIVLEDDVAHALAGTALAVAAGQLVVPNALTRQIAPRPLSHREKEILGLVVLGLTNRQIADRLYVAESTVKTHLSSAFRKLDVRSRAEAVARLLDPEACQGLGVLPSLTGDVAA
jgi:DNA-binding NarL/FixJ family response regulator